METSISSFETQVVSRHPLIEKFARSPRSDERAIAAVLTIESENGAPAPNLTPHAPCLGGSGVDYEGWFDSPFEGCLPVVSPPMTKRDIFGASRVGRQFIASMRRKFKIKVHKPAAIPSSAVRARARRSPIAHGGALKAADDGDGGDGDGDGEPPNPPRPLWVLIADLSSPRIELAAVETINRLITFRMVEATGSTRAEALAVLSHLVSKAGGVPAWEAWDEFDAAGWGQPR
jgi:hypothetical protein